MQKDRPGSDVENGINADGYSANDTNPNNKDSESKEIFNENLSQDENCANEPSGEEYVESSNDVVSQIGTLKAKVSELNDLYLRAQADIQNMQRRNLEEVKKARALL